MLPENKDADDLSWRTLDETLQRDNLKIAKEVAIDVRRGVDIDEVLPQTSMRGVLRRDIICD